jgi:RimJ/RimL family protein N-acetyltransferase
VKLVFGEKERCSEFIQEQLGMKVVWGEWYEAIGLEEDGKLVAAALYNLMTDFDCAMHFAASSPKFLQGEFINAIFRYPFRQMGLRRVTSYTWANNERALSLVKAFGFEFEGVLREAGGTADEPVNVYVLGLLRKDCKYG